MWISTDLKFATLQKFFMDRKWPTAQLSQDLNTTRILLFVTSWYKLGILLSAFEQQVLEHASLRNQLANTDYFRIVQFYSNGLLNLNAIEQEFKFKKSKTIDMGNLKYSFTTKDPISYFTQLEKVITPEQQKEMISNIYKLPKFRVISVWKLYEVKKIESVELVFHGEQLHLFSLINPEITKKHETKRKLFMEQMEILFNKKMHNGLPKIKPNN